MSIFISLVIFALGLALFFITNNKIKKIKDNILIEDTKKELESLITEFNSAAARNIELLESKINELQDTIQKANGKMTDLDDKIGRANRPFVVEKFIDRRTTPDAQTIPEKKTETAAAELIRQNRVPPVQQDAFQNRKYTSGGPVRPVAQEKKKEKSRPVNAQKLKAPVKTTPVKKETPKTAPGERDAGTVKKNTEPLTRSEELKKYILEGLSRQELIAKGFMENEINLLSFLIKKNV